MIEVKKQVAVAIADQKRLDGDKVHHVIMALLHAIPPKLLIGMGFDELHRAEICKTSEGYQIVGLRIGCGKTEYIDAKEAASALVQWMYLCSDKPASRAIARGPYREVMTRSEETAFWSAEEVARIDETARLLLANTAAASLRWSGADCYQQAIELERARHAALKIGKEASDDY